jgi:hypothetical protein
MTWMHEDGKRIIRFAWYDREYGPMLSQNELTNRGWTRSAIRKQIGEPDCYGFNPRGGALVRLYSEARVRLAKFRVVK